MPTLTRLDPGPLHVDIRRGALSALAQVLRDLESVRPGKVLVAVGETQLERLREQISEIVPSADYVAVPASVSTDHPEIIGALAAESYTAVVAVGGGRTIDVAKYVAFQAQLPVVVVATNLAHDGFCSPVASLELDGTKQSLGVDMPVAVLIDFDLMGSAPEQLIRAGIGDVASNISAIADWRLANEVQQEPINGLAMAHARVAAEAVIGHPGAVCEDEFLVVLAEALVLSGIAMAVAGTSRPCSGACHEILHAIDRLFPNTASHGELAGMGAVFATHLRGDPEQLARLVGCLARHELPVLPEEVGLEDEQFVKAVMLAPQTRADRYTILEHQALSADQVSDQLHSLKQQVSAYRRSPNGQQGREHC